jgi:hypothetical protein
MAKQGVPEQQILEKIHTGRLDGVIGKGATFGIDTRLRAGLHGSTLAYMHQEGVSDAVLDALQAKFLSQYIDIQRLRYQQYGKGSRT